MFWDKGYTQSQNIENLLQKEDVTVEELLDDEDILQECKTQKRPLIQFLTRPDVIKRLIVLTITEPPENLTIAERFKYSNTACEILTFGLPSLDEKLVEDTAILQTLYSFLENEPPLNPLLSSFFSKTFSMLISKKPEQDWFLYQKMCLQVLEFIKSRGNFLDLIFKHFATPVIMDLLLQIIREVQGGTLKKNLYEWLTEQSLVERVISILGNPDESDKHTNVAEFVIDLIKHGRSMRQSVQEDSYEPAFTGSNPLLQTLEDENTITLLLNSMLRDNPRESSIVAAISIVLTLVDESIVEEPASDKALKKMIDKEKENYERVVTTVIRTISPRIQDFHRLLLDPPVKNDIVTTITHLSPPFGLTRLEICRLITVLLQIGNTQISNAICETDFFNTLLKLFKQYSWNNFLHSEVEKCLEYVFATFDQSENENGFEMKPSALQTYVIVNCKIISKLIDCWIHNTEVQSSKNGRRLGYMGHLIQILKNVTLSVSKSDHIGALIVSNLNEDELEQWKSLTNPEDGELSKELHTQMKLLADCDPYIDVEYGVAIPKVFRSENISAEFYNSSEANMSDSVDDQGSPLNESPLSKLYEYLESENVINCLLTSSDEIAVNLQRQLKVWGTDSDENLDDDHDIMEDFNRFGGDASKVESSTLNMTISPWGSDPFSDPTCTSGVGGGGGDTVTSSSGGVGGWADFSSNNFADFDSHFSAFASDLGDKFDPSQNLESVDSGILFEKGDNNANVEKMPIERDDQVELQLKNAKNLDLLNVENQNDRMDSERKPEDTLEFESNSNESVDCTNNEKFVDNCVAMKSETVNQTHTTVVANGPTTKLENAQEDKSNHSSDTKSITPTDSTKPEEPSQNDNKPTQDDSNSVTVPTPLSTTTATNSSTITSNETSSIF